MAEFPGQARCLSLFFLEQIEFTFPDFIARGYFL